MRTPSLRRRVVLWSVSVLALLLLVVGVSVDLALGTVLKAEQRQRLESVASLATALTGLSDQKLADRLSMPGIEASIEYPSGDTVIGTPQPGQRPTGRPPKPPEATTPAAAITQEGGKLVARETLRPGVTLKLETDSGQIEAELARFRLIMAIASVVAIALAAALLPLVLRRAMRPLDELTRAATETAAGGRGRRLDPQDPASDLGRAASQFDAMLEELEGAERRAEESADRLGRFLSDASHELRTPLAAVSAGAERLIREPLDDADRDRVLVQLVRETRRAGRLVEDLLLVSRLGDLTIDARPRSVHDLLVDAAERTAPRRDAPTVEVSGDDATVAVDAGRIDQVLANLIANAGAAGARRVRLHARIDGGDAVVRVSDDGPGIPAASREAVFDRMVRLDPARSAARGGAGLGLPIARGLAEAHGGSLACVDGGPGDLPGAVLELRLPRVVPAPGAEPSAARTPAEATAS
ncbi:HAMP domain-containing sensor histidine kinase [Amnibacterium kyonggiense]|uniref:histidine kinase n=1 Tax=Amnibacterium kyonggiense TaxID=595671 RepID=A0A4R7FQ11_9MICO|nr:HAMP domain-containing sensor histidine kinase [Amnibacterium kyonggiense]TDS79766.1 signal transduction histidine kinase [Amnibacterium kyonggiense]